MVKAFGLITMLIALYIGMSLYTKGMDQTYEAAFGPAEHESYQDTQVTSRADRTEPSSPNRRVMITDRVRQRVTSVIQEGARRRDY